MELLQLHYFAVTARYEHITRAAEALHIAQPALSQTIRRLEEELGVPLLEKKGRNVALTAAGRLLYERLQVLLPQLDALPGELQQAAGLAGQTIRIRISAATLTITDAILAYKKAHPEVILCLTRTVDADACDFSITTQKAGSRLPAECDAVSEEVFLAVPKNTPLGKRREIDLAEIRGEDLLSINGTRPFRTLCDGFCRTAGFAPHIVFESDSPASIRDLIGAGLGIGFWPAFTWGPIAEDENIRLLRIRSPECRRMIVICAHGENSPAHTEFRRFLLEYLRRCSR